MIDLAIEGDLRRARQAAEDVLAGRSRSTSDGALAGSLSVLALVAWSEGRLSDALRLLTAAVHRAERGSPDHLHLHRLGTALGFVALGDFDTARTILDQTQRELESSRDRSWAGGARIFSSRLDLAEGRLDRAAAEARAGLELSERLGATFLRSPGEWVLADVALARGDLEGASHHVRRYCQELPSGRGVLGPGAYVWTEARLAEAMEDQGRANQLRHEIVDNLFGYRRLLVDHPGAAAWLVRTSLVEGHRDGAEAVVLCVEQLAADNAEIDSVVAVAAHARALFERDPTGLATAAERHRHLWARASAHEDAATALADRGDGRAAAVQLGRAIEGYRRAGAECDAARLTDRTSAGRRRRGRHRTWTPASGWASLTDTERRVAQVVAEGCTNAEAARRLFVSRHTVDFHLRQIFRKLGIRSRVALARVVIEHVGDPRPGNAPER